MGDTLEGWDHWPVSEVRYSQSNEDEIIAEIFAAIGDGNKRFVEFGCGKGNMNNTIALLKRGWSGIWLDQGKKITKSAREMFSEYPVQVVRRIVTPENVNKVVRDPLDFLSIDVDGNDFAVWEAIRARPRVVCIETGHPEIGAALEALKALGSADGYTFYGVSESQVNAFFIAQPNLRWLRWDDKQEVPCWVYVDLDGKRERATDLPWGNPL